MNNFWFYFISHFFFNLLSLIPILIVIAFYTLNERKIMGWIQRRKGPNVVGIWGLLQPLADGLKLLFKEMIIPKKANLFLFLLSPLFTFALSLFLWIFFSFFLNNSWIDFSLSFLIFLSFSSLNVYGIIISGWASNSKYAFLGSLRSSAQMISYEISLGLIFLNIGLISNSFNLIDILLIQQKNIWNFFSLFPLSIIFLISILAETNRAPFDLPEAEAELVAGYNVEYSSIIFALFFLGEYSNMIIMSFLFILLFFGTSYIYLKTLFIIFFFIWVRATFPRYRYDQLMEIGWKIFLPITLSFFFFLIGFLNFWNGSFFYILF